MRIASLLSAATEILYGLGLGEQVVAVSHECDYPPDATAKPRVTRSNIDPQRTSDEIDRDVREKTSTGAALYEIDGDRLAALAPDLIVTQAQCDVCAVRLEDVQNLVRSRPDLRQTRVVSLNPGSINDVLSDIVRIGQASGAAEQAAAFVADLRRRINAVQQKLLDIDDAQRPKVVMIEWIEPLMLAANWMPELINLAGGRCDLTQAGAPSAYAEWPALVDYDPDVILIAPCGFDLARTRQEAQSLRRQSAWPQLKATRTRQVFLADGNAYFNRSGPRLIDSLELLAHLVHPRRFERPDWADSRVFEPFA